MFSGPWFGRKPERATEATSVPSTLNVTVPVVVTDVEVTLAVKITVCPPTDGFGELLSPVVTSLTRKW
ncbi:MAG: hypothetical protein M0T85_02975 [Dehalococcoidales bacterium]|nr:hypothetical protein [Dehalococcoidales bacterium]